MKFTFILTEETMASALLVLEGTENIYIPNAKLEVEAIRINGKLVKGSVDHIFPWDFVDYATNKPEVLQPNCENCKMPASVCECSSFDDEGNEL